jgi:hypothetical protein
LLESLLVGNRPERRVIGCVRLGLGEFSRHGKGLVGKDGCGCQADDCNDFICGISIHLFRSLLIEFTKLRSQSVQSTTSGVADDLKVFPDGKNFTAFFVPK